MLWRINAQNCEVICEVVHKESFGILDRGFVRFLVWKEFQ